MPYVYREKPPGRPKPETGAFAKAAAGAGQDRISVPSHLQETFFTFLTLVKNEGGEALNEAGCLYLDGILQNGRRIGEPEFAALYRLALKIGTPMLRETLDRKFLFDKDMVSLREPTLLKSSYEGFKWPAQHESD